MKMFQDWDGHTQLQGQDLENDGGISGHRGTEMDELYVMLEGLKRAYMEDKFDIEFETDHEEAY